MASSILLKKQEDLNARLVRDLLRLPENKKCFDCPVKSPFFVNVTLSTFICTRCSGLVREVGHRVKSISASTFTGPELLALELGGNGMASKIWLSSGYNTVDTPEPETDGEVRGFMRQKYYERKWLNYDLAVSHDLAVKDRIKELFTEDGLPKQQQRRRRATMENNTTNGTMNLGLQQSTRSKTIPTPLDLTTTNKVQPPTIQTAPLIMNAYQPQPILTSPKQPKVEMTSDAVPVSPLPTQQPTTPMDSFFADLAGLTLSDAPIPTQTSSHTHSHSSRQLQHTGNILTPTSLNQINTYSNENGNKRHSIQPIVTNNAPQTILTDDGSSLSSHRRATSLQDTDPYSALRNHHTQNQQRYEQTISAIRSITPLSPSSNRLDHSVAKKHDTKNTNTFDPYAALRQLSDAPDRQDSARSSPPLTTTMIPQSITNINWNSSPTKQQHHCHPDPSSDSNQIPTRQDKSYLKNKTEEWVQASLHLATGDVDDVMTPLPSSPSSSTTYSTTSSNANNNNKNSKSNTSNAFSDLDPLTAYKGKKTTAPSFIQSNS